MAGSRAAAASAARIDVLPALSALSALLLIEVTAESRSARGGSWRWAHAHIGEGRLVSAVRGRLRGSVHRYSEMLLLGHLLRELEVIRMG